MRSILQYFYKHVYYLILLAWFLHLLVHLSAFLKSGVAPVWTDMCFTPFLFSLSKRSFTFKDFKIFFIQLLLLIVIINFTVLIYYLFILLAFMLLHVLFLYLSRLNIKYILSPILFMLDEDGYEVYITEESEDESEEIEEESGYDLHTIIEETEIEVEEEESDTVLEPSWKTITRSFSDSEEDFGTLLHHWIFGNDGRVLHRRYGDEEPMFVFNNQNSDSDSGSDISATGFESILDSTSDSSSFATATFPFLIGFKKLFNKRIYPILILCSAISVIILHGSYIFSYISPYINVNAILTSLITIIVLRLVIWIFKIVYKQLKKLINNSKKWFTLLGIPVATINDFEFDVVQPSPVTDEMDIQEDSGSDISSINSVDMQENLESEGESDSNSDISSINSVDMEENSSESDYDYWIITDDALPPSDRSFAPINSFTSNPDEISSDPEDINIVNFNSYLSIKSLDFDFDLDSIITSLVTVTIVWSLLKCYNKIYKYIMSVSPAIFSHFEEPTLEFIAQNTYNDKLFPITANRLNNIPIDDVLIRFVRDKWHKSGISTESISDLKMIEYIRELINGDETSVDKYNWELVCNNPYTLWLERKPRLNKMNRDSTYSIDEDYGKVIKHWYHDNIFPLDINKPLPPLPHNLSTIIEEEDEVGINPKLLETKLTPISDQLPITAKTQTFPDDIIPENIFHLMNEINNHWPSMSKTQQLIDAIHRKSTSTYSNSYTDFFNSSTHLDESKTTELSDMLKQLSLVLSLVSITILDLDLLEDCNNPLEDNIKIKHSVFCVIQ